MQYADFAVWQRSWLSGEVLERELAYWREHLAGAPPVLELPTDRPRPLVQSLRGRMRPVAFDPGLPLALGALAQRHRATLFMVLTAAFQSLLARVSGAPELCLGTPIAGRTRHETEHLIGFFVNTLVLRGDLTGDPAFADHLAAVRREALAAYAHQDLPFEKLVSELAPERSLAYTPLFQVMLAFQNAPAGPLDLPGVRLTPLPLESSASRFDLTLSLTETARGLAGFVEYDTALFDPSTIERLMGHFETLLRSASSGTLSAEQRISELALLSDPERQQLLGEWRGVEGVAPAVSVPARLTLQALLTPSAAALEWGEERLTHGALARRAGEVARRLRAAGVGAETRVGLLVERSLDLVVALLGIWQAGGAAVPLDPGQPASRLQLLLDDALPAGASAVVSQRGLRELHGMLRLGSTPVVWVDGEEEAGPEVPLAAPAASDLAYLLYTSGSTGQPKAVMVEHGSLAHTLGTALDVFSLQMPGERMPVSAPATFDAFLLELLLPLLCGGTAVLLENRPVLDMALLLAELKRSTLLFAVPSVMRRLTTMILEQGARLPRLRRVFTGAETVGRDLAASMRKAFPGAPVTVLYGPTEAAIFATWEEPDETSNNGIGRPLPGVAVEVRDAAGALVPAGSAGELWLGGPGLARGYHGRPDLTADRFVPSPSGTGARLYRTGDRVRFHADGRLEFLGRIDQQVKVRGFRIEPGEVEAALLGCPGVEAAAVVVQRRGAGDERLVAYVAGPAGEAGLKSTELRRLAEARLPAYMVPSRFVCLDRLPVTRHGKVDRRALAALDAQRAADEPAALQAPPANLEGLVAAVFREVLGVEKVGPNDNFFDLGGHSLLLAEVQSRLSKELGEDVPLLEIYRNPNVGALARALAARRQPAPAEAAAVVPPVQPEERAVAIIGLAGRFPGAPDLAAFWRNLRDGVESISFFSDAELDRAGVDPALRRSPGYVPAAGVLADAELFDAGFFDIGPREAQVMDPQQRVLLECAAAALESAGYGAGSPAAAALRIGVFAGGGTSTYALNNLVGHPDLDALEMSLGNDKDFLATRVSYKLDLKGPALTVQTACSTSLVAVHLAVRSLLEGECDLALAGGVNVSSSQIEGYVYREGGVASPDGHNRTFDERARGAVNGNGAGIVVLKPLAQAVTDGDPIHAVVLGSALNNDGAGKVGFTAPSEEGQAKVILAAQAAAGVSPEGIGYVEAHGSATPVGDPIEIAALTRAFRAGTARRGFCAVGSVKTNIGHNGSAAGIAGLLKTVLALEHRQIPASLHYERPNPRIDFASSPFYVNQELADWPAAEGPRRAGVSSFGLGGTNVHVVLEEAPARPEASPSRPWQPLVLSARTEAALEAVTGRLAAYLAEHPEEDLADVAATLATGRKGHAWRRAVVCKDGRDAFDALSARDPRRLLAGTVDGASRPVAFLFSGLGEQYPAMAAGLYRDEPAFRERLDRYAAVLAPLLGVDPLEVLFAGADRREAETASGPDLRRMLGRGGSVTAAPSGAAERLARTAVSQPVLFAVELALAGLWREWGIEPQAMLGYSLGEYVAACVAGVFSPEDALRLVAERARRIDALPAGAMLAVPLAPDELRPLLAGEAWVAAVNGPRLTVVSGTPRAVADLARQLGAEGIASRQLATTHAFHCPLLEPVAAALIDLLREMPLAAPRIPYLSNLTGTWITAAQATDPESWAEQLCRPVQFAAGVAELWREPGRVLLEIGPGASLSSLALQQAAGSAAADPVAVASLPGAYERQPDCAHVMGAAAKLWLSGVRLDWRAVWGRERRRRLALPSYPFERRRYWIDATRQGAARGQEAPLVVLVKETGLGESVAARLRQAGARVMEVGSGGGSVDVDVDRLMAALGLEGWPALDASSSPASGAFPGTLHGRPNLKNPYVAPESEIERHLAVIWQELLGIDPIGVHDSFFELGGDSLQAVQVIARVRGAWGVEIGPGALFEASTPRALAAMVQALRPAGETAAGKPEIVPLPRQEAAGLPLSFAQQRLWFIDQLEGGSLYNVPLALRVEGELSVAVLSRVLAEVVRRHENLRTVFPGEGGQARQVILPPAGVVVPVVDLAGLSTALQAPVAEGLVTEEARRPFDLASGPLLRAGLWRLGTTEHVLLLTLHHIVSDGWSLGVLVREMTALYPAFAARQPSPLAELPVQYADFAVWQRSWLSGDVLEGELAWWCEHLSGAPPLLELLTDRPRLSVQSRKGGMLSLAFDPELSAALSRLAQHQAATLFMVLLAVFQSLLGRLAGAAEVCVGVPIAGRTQRETEDLIGFFVNTLVMRGDLSGDPSFFEHLARVRREALAVYAHQELPFEKLVGELAPERSLSATPLFQVFLALQNVPLGPVELPRVKLVPVMIESSVTRFDLEVSFSETAGGLTAVVQYDASLFDRTTIARLCGQMETVLRSAVASPERRLSDLALLTAAESQQLLVEWRGVSGASPSEATVPVRLAEQELRTPEAVAVVWGQEHLSYGDLDRRVGRLAYRLRVLGVRAETRVGLLVERSLDLVVGLLAIWRAGGAAVPLDPGQPLARLTLLVADALAGRAALVAQHGLSELLAELPLGEVPVAWVDAEEEETGAEPAALAIPVRARDLAYLIYTSGTTGQPKAVMVEHGSLAHTLAAVQEVFGFTALDRMPVLASASFDIFLFELLAPLLAGGTAVLFDLKPTLDLALLAEELRSSTLLHAVPAVMRQLTARVLSQAVEPTRLRRVFVGGDAVGGELLESMRRAFPDAGLTVLYGPTEGTILASWEEGERRPGNGLGQPLPGVTVEVRDSLGSVVPIGVAGELWLGGPGVARGYLGRPELTAERFVPDPEGFGGRLYRTGDRVRFAVTGRLEFLGRVDQQVKVRGFRIEPGEVEAALLGCPGVREAVVLARRQGEDERLVAYVVAEGPLPSAELRRFVEARLPSPMVPGHFVFLSALPLTRHGKVDRRALLGLAIEEAGGEPGASPVSGALRTPIEELVAGLYAEVLHVERVGLQDDFFELGGHSLLATQLASRLREMLGRELPLRTLFEQPTVAGLAQEIEKSLRSGVSAVVKMAERVPRDANLPLSFAQERLWFLQQLEPGSATYNMPLELELSGDLRTGALSAALAEVLRRHESLRTTFVPVAGVLCQGIAPPVPAAALALPLVDLSALPEAARQSVADGLARWHAGRGFDLERGPLFVWLLVRLAREGHRFLLNLHHAIADGWSIAVLARELGELYAAALEGRPGRLPELPIQYADFAHWQRRWLADKQEEELAYWESQLGGEVASADLPTDRPRPAIQTFRGGRRHLVLPEELAARLKRLGRAESVTLFMTLLTATQALLARHSGEHDVAVGAPVAGRQRGETEGLIGCFLNTLVLRTDTSGQPSFRALAARVRTVTLEAYSHQDVPFEAVLARLGLRRDLSRSPLFQVLFNLLNLPATELSLPGLELRGRMPAEVPSKLDMTFYISEDDGSIGIHLVYNADLFDEARMDEVLAQLGALLRQAVERPDEPLENLSLVTAAARAVLPDPGAELLEPAVPGIARLLLEREEAQPDREALCFGEETWTYSRLGSRAREIARAIQAACGGPPAPGATGPVVAVCGPRSPELIASLCGVFLSGGVLLTLDHKLPPARLRLMVEVAKPDCLVYVGEARPEDGWLWKLGEMESLAMVSVPVASGVPPEPVPDELATGFADPRPDDPAYIFFTSGTTGRPKAVLGRHKGLSHFLTWQRETFGVGPGDRAAQLTGLSFDVVLRDIFLPLTSGAALYVPDEEEMSPERILPWLAERAITVLHTVPSLSGAWLGGAAPGFSSDALRLTFFAGEPLLGQVAERWRAVFPRTEVVNLYGPTETTLAKCFYRVPDPPSLRIQPVGAPLPQTQALVLAGIGGDLLCGIGEVGEIVLRTPFRSLGYLNNPVESQLRFRPNPFREDVDDLLYFTGDRGRYRLDGTLEILGRFDTQVKIRGVRIEPAEIQVCLGRHEAVSESAVVLREVQPGDHRLVAYIVPRPGAVFDPEALRRHLRLELPEVMIPAAFVALDALPLTPNGKLDSRALPAPVVPGGGAGEQRALHTPVEEITAGLWAELLGLAHVGPDDNFFELGGHSLIGARLISRLRQALAVDLPLRVLFEAPTVAGLAAEIERLRRGASELPTIASFRQDRGAPPPLSFAQERYWTGRHLEALSVASTIPMLMHLAGPLDRACLRLAIAAVVDRHEVLRTSFRDGPEGPIQVIHPAVPVVLPEVDLERLGAGERMAEVRQLGILDGRLHFDYERPPLFRATLFRCAAEEHILLFTIHHVASDWWSGSVLRHEVSALYLAFSAGHPSPLPPLAAQFQDFARWQRRLSLEEAQDSQVTFWREHLSGAVPIDLWDPRRGRPRPRQRTFAAATEEILVPGDLERQLDAFSAQQGVTLFMTLLAAFKALLHCETGQDDLVVPCSFANRNQLETESLIGNLATGLPLRTRLSGVRTFRELLQRVRDVTLLAYDHPDIFWEPVVEGMSFLEEGDRGGLTTFRILFQLVKVPPTAQAPAGSDLRITQLPVDTGKIRLDLSLFLSQTDRLAGRFRYNRDVLDEARVLGMCDRFLRILAAVVADPECPLAELPLADPVAQELSAQSLAIFSGEHQLQPEVEEAR